MAIYGTLGDIDVGNTDYPSIQPTLDLNFAKTKALDQRVTFYRSSLGTYVDDKGIIRTVPENVPRFDHDPTTGESLGLLIEEGRINLMPYSDNTVLTSSANVTTSRSTGLDGNPTSALNVTYNSNSGSFVLTANATVSATNTYTFSVYIKKNVNSTSGNAGAVMYSYFNNGTAGQWSGTILNEDGQHLGQAPIGVWKRYSKTITVTSGTGVQITLPGYDTSGLNADYFGAQLELGAFPTSYIPTSGSTATRSADICYMDGTNFSSWYSPNGGTAYIDIIPRGISNSLPYQVYFSFNSTSGDRWGISHQNGTSGSYPSNAVVPYVGTGGAFSNILGGTFTPGQRISVAMNQPNGTNIESSRDGASVQSVITSRNPAITNLLLGAQISDNSGLMGNIKRFMYYPKRLTNTQLQNLTA